MNWLKGDDLAIHYSTPNLGYMMDTTQVYIACSEIIADGIWNALLLIHQVTERILIRSIADIDINVGTVR